VIKLFDELISRLPMHPGGGQNITPAVLVPFRIKRKLPFGKTNADDAPKCPLARDTVPKEIPEVMLKNIAWPMSLNATMKVSPERSM